MTLLLLLKPVRRALLHVTVPNIDLCRRLGRPGLQTHKLPGRGSYSGPRGRRLSLYAFHAAPRGMAAKLI